MTLPPKNFATSHRCQLPGSIFSHKFLKFSNKHIKKKALLGNAPQKFEGTFHNHENPFTCGVGEHEAPTLKMEGKCLMSWEFKPMSWKKFGMSWMMVTIASRSRTLWLGQVFMSFFFSFIFIHQIAEINKLYIKTYYIYKFILP